MSATPALAHIASAADELARQGYSVLAAELRNARIELADLLDAVDEKIDEIDACSHGLSDSPADIRLRHAVHQLRPIA